MKVARGKKGQQVNAHSSAWVTQWAGSLAEGQRVRGAGGCDRH